MAEEARLLGDSAERAVADIDVGVLGSPCARHSHVRNVECRRSIWPAAHSEPVWSGRLDVLSFVSLATGPDVEFDYLPFVKAPVVLADDVGVVNEHIVTAVARDEAEALLAVKKLDSSSH